MSLVDKFTIGCLLIALQGYTLATQLGHSIVDPMPSLFTFKIADKHLAELSGVIVSQDYRTNLQYIFPKCFHFAELLIDCSFLI